jgi:SnoaL-like protein
MIQTTHHADTLALAYAYARGIDERDLALLATLLRPDVRIAGPGFETTSRSEFLDSLKILDRYQSTYHLVGNHSGEWADDEFRGDTYCVASHLYAHEGGARKFDMGIRYADRIVREGAQLVFQERVLKVVWTQDLAASLGMPA